MKRGRPACAPLAAVAAAGGTVISQLLSEHRIRPLHALTTGVCAGAMMVAAEQWGHLPCPIWVVATPRRLRHGLPNIGAAALLPTPPAMNDLESVMPIAQMQRSAGGTLALLSLERYADGFLLHSLLFDPERSEASLRPRPSPDRPHRPHLVFTISDDRGNRYDAWPAGFSGHGGRWRFMTPFAPVIDPQAREMRVTVPPPVWERFDDRHPEHVAEQQGQDWHFVVPLTPSAKAA